MSHIAHFDDCIIYRMGGPFHLPMQNTLKGVYMYTYHC